MLAKSKVKKLISNEDASVRGYAADYFVDGMIGDTEVTELLLDLLDRGVKLGEARAILLMMSDLPHTQETLKRIDQLQYEDVSARYHIDHAIASAELDLLEALPDISPESIETKKLLKKRASLAKQRTGTLWKSLWEHSSSGKGKNIDDFDFSHGRWLIKELCTRDDFPFDKYRAMLKIDYPALYNGWDDTYLSMIAGESRDTEAIRFLVDRLKIDGDYLRESAIKALVKIGTDEVIEILGAEYPNEDISFKIFANGVLEKVKSEKSEDLMLKFFIREKEVSIKTGLAYGLCKHFSKKAIPNIMILLRYGYDRQMVDMEEALYVNHLANGITHKDMDKWRKRIEEENERIENLSDHLLEGTGGIEEFTDLRQNFNGMLEKMKKIKELNEFYSNFDGRIGRNEPCPCGSGSKYKKCCGK